jgi:hypothetical protein
MTTRNLTDADRALADGIARAHPLERKRRVQRTGPVRMTGADARLAQNDEDRFIPDDTPCLEDGRDNCDDAGTGEGRWHGRM